MTFYDIFTYLCTFTIIIPLAVFCLFPVIDHLKTPICHLLIKISLVFVCYFVLLIIPYMICLLYTSPSPRDVEESRMPSSA